MRRGRVPGPCGELADHQPYDRHHIRVVHQIHLTAALAPRSHETGQFQFRQMLADRRQRAAHQLRKTGHIAFTL